MAQESLEKKKLRHKKISETVKALTHPRMLSALFMLILASVAVKFIVDKYEP